MPEHREDIKGWVQKISDGEKPYAMMEDNGILIFSVILDRQRSIDDVVRDTGFVRWVAVNPSSRKRSTSAFAKPVYDRIIWHPQETMAQDGKVGWERELQRTDPGHHVYFYREWTAQFNVVMSGDEEVLSECKRSHNSCGSQFFAERNEYMKDWLGAVAEMCKGLPGGQMLLGPLIRLRDQGKADEHNAKIDSLLTHNSEVSTDALQRVIHLTGEVEEVRTMLAIMAMLLNEEAWRLRTNRARRNTKEILRSAPEISQFPLPTAPITVIRELDVLCQSDTTLLDDCAILAGYRFPHGKSRVETIRNFVENLTGQSEEVLTNLFESMHSTRPGSRLLEAAAAYFSNQGPQQLPT